MSNQNLNSLTVKTLNFTGPSIYHRGRPWPLPVTSLDLHCGKINDVSGIYFCDGSAFTTGNSLDISANGVSFMNNGTEQMTINQIGNVAIGAKPPSAGWVSRAFFRNWKAITSSSDGKKLAAVISSNNNGYIWTSTDSGGTWVQAITPATQKNWKVITSSSDGTKLAACDDSYIWLSTDAGVNWATNSNTLLLNAYWSGITSSSSGTKLAAIVGNGGYVGGGGYIYASNDAGLTWNYSTAFLPYDGSVAYPGKENWSGITSSSDGTKLAACANGATFASSVTGALIWMSTDSGLTWNHATGFCGTDGRENWKAITSSDDFCKLAAVVDGGNIWTSIDSGVSWSQSATQLNWSGITSNNNGTKLAAVVDGGNIWTSTWNVAKGLTWIETTTTTDPSGPSTQSWSGITSDNNGTKLVAVVDGGNIWTLQNLTQLSPPTILDVSGSLQVQGDITATGDIISNFTSDIRFKTNIKKIKNPLEKLSKINGYTYNWIESDLHPYNGEDTGVIAQEVETIDLPGVSVTRESGYKGVKYERLIPLLLESIKSLQETNIKQQKQINQLMENKLLKN